MTSVREMFEMFDSEFLEFDRIENKLSNRPDLHAFMMLDKLVPGNMDTVCDMICAVGHDEIFLDISIEDLTAAKIKDTQVRDLIRCGVRLYESESLVMFV